MAPSSDKTDAGIDKVPKVGFLTNCYPNIEARSVDVDDTLCEER